MKLRLLLFQECNRQCDGCCNKDWDLDSLPVCRDFTGYDKIMLTGGEPMLKPNMIKQVVDQIRSVNKCPIILYTAKTNNVISLIEILQIVDGLTITLHNQYDVNSFDYFDFIRRECKIKGKSLRINIFDGIKISNISPEWIVKDKIKWIKNSSLPEDEVFMRYSIYAI